MQYNSTCKNVMSLYVQCHLKQISEDFIDKYSSVALLVCDISLVVPVQN